MADSTRRSGRATKGQNKKLETDVDEAAPAPKKVGRPKKKEETPPESEEIIRCICGVTSEEEDEEERTMICCDTCAAWQHNECMEIPDKLPEGEQYFCEQCRPDLHKAILAKIAQGEKPWEERAKIRDKEKGKGRKGRGKRGRKSGRPSSAKANGAEVDEDTSHVDEASEVLPEPETPGPESSKRKHAESVQDSKSPIHTEPPSKTRKVSSPQQPKIAASSSRRKSVAATSGRRESATFALQTTLVDKIADLESTDRQKVAGAIVKMFVDETRKSIKSGSFSLPEGQAIEDFGLRLGLAVEFAIYMNYWGMEAKPSQFYIDRLRMILANVKQNSSLRDQLLTGQLSPNEFSKMTSEDMASKELKEQKAEMLKESEKQSMIVQDEGPRIRRTHKGEELVDDHHQIAGASDSAFTATIRKRPSEIDTTMTDQSPELVSAISPAIVEAPEVVAPAVTKESTAVISQGSPPQSAAPASTNKFDYQKVWSTVKTPSTETSRLRQTPRVSDISVPMLPQEADAEIDRLLKDEEPDDDEPYSPTEYNTLPSGTVWSGVLTMPGVAGFKGVAKHCAGADLSTSTPYSALIPNTLTVEGRIDVDRAGQYLCGLKWSATSDVVVVSVIPEPNEEDTSQFNKLFDYFKQRGRYGVIGKNPNLAVKDTYVVPLEAGTRKKPDFVELLDVCSIDNPTPERLLLMAFVVKNNNSPSVIQTPQHPESSSLASPTNLTSQTPATFQNVPAPTMPFQPPPPAYGQFGSPIPGQHPYGTPPMNPPPYVGIEAARYALGDLANCPAVATLVHEAPRSGVPEFLAIKTILERNPSLGDDYPTLVNMMGQELARRQQGLV